MLALEIKVLGNLTFWKGKFAGNLKRINMQKQMLCD